VAAKEKPRGLPPGYQGGPWLSVRGAMNEPVRDIQEVAISFRPEDRDQPGTSNRLSVGAINQTRPEGLTAVGPTPADVDRA